MMENHGYARIIMNWHLAMGVDETISEVPVNRLLISDSPSPQVPLAVRRAQDKETSDGFQSEPAAISASSPPPNNENSTLNNATALAAASRTYKELETAITNFTGCSLRKTATNTVFADGNPEGRVLLIGEAPGAEEDRRGRPFVGPSGQLLNKMLASIGLDRTQVLISNIVFWRPPGNRTPTPLEVASCLPFVQRIIELMEPEIIVPLGGPATKSLLEQTAGIGKLRGRWFNYQTPQISKPIAATPLFHPAYLLRTPAQKRTAWRDLIMIRARLNNQREF